MPFAKNRIKTGGKVKGVKNRSTIIKEKLQIDSWSGLSAFIEGPGLRRLVKEMDKLSGRDYERAFTTLAEFAKPKLSRQEHTGQVQSINYNVDLTKKEIKAITETFENDY